MSYLDLLDRAWSLVDTLRPPGEAINVRDLDTPELEALAGVDAEGQRHLLIRIAAGAKVTPDRRSGGVHIIRRELLDGGVMRPFVDVVCLKPHLNELFTVIASEILDLLPDHRNRPDAAAHEVLNRWRDLVDREFRTGALALEKVQGIFGELWHLREVVRHNPGATNVWVGAQGAVHDIAGNGSALEVKTSRARRGRLFEINGEHQLDSPPDWDLYLGCLKLEVTHEDALMVEELINDMVDLGADREALLTDLARTGVTLAQLAIAPVAFHVLEHRVYRVAGDFPRLIGRSFATGALPSGIVQLTYLIDLTQEPPVPVSAGEAARIYRTLAGVT